uniref:Uncharacterized protein n=1 Tax=Myoviridae sp. ctZgq1 TaxID=2826666 RepID=A0A8S5LXF5_9CAUD|nr:MAG TPA: hypothetical protein [Myoviridae sp. ctZgq1]
MYSLIFIHDFMKIYSTPILSKIKYFRLSISKIF